MISYKQKKTRKKRVLSSDQLPTLSSEMGLKSINSDSVFDPDYIKELVNDIGTFSHMLLYLKEAILSDCFKEVIHIRLDEFLRVLNSVVNKYQNLNSVDLQNAAETLTAKMKAVNFTDVNDENKKDLFREVFSSIETLVFTFGHVLTNFLMGDIGNDSVFRLPVSQENKSFENVSMDSVDSSVEKGNCSPIQLDNMLLKNNDSIELALSYVKTWSKYTKNVVSWVEKKLNLELESSRNIVKLAEATRTNLGLQEFMPLQSVFTSALTNDMESSLLLQQTIAALQANKFVQPLLGRKNEMERQRKEIKVLWKQAKNKVLETETALKKAKLLCTQRQDEYEKAKSSMFRAEEEHQSSSGGLVKNVNKQLEKKRRLEEEALQRVEEANEFYKVCVINVEERRNDLEIIKRAVLTQLQELVFQCDLTLKAVTVNLFHMQQQQAASLANNLQSFCDTAKLYEPGQEYSKFVQAMSSTEEEKVDGGVTKPSTNSSHSSGYGPADSLGDAVRLPHSSSKTDEDRCSAGADVPGPSFNRSWMFGMISDSESTGGSSESRSLDSESISPGDFHRKLPRTPSSGTMSSADDLDEREPPSPSEGGPNSVGVYKKPLMSKAALTHKFRKWRSPTKCRDCEGIVVFQGVECEECLLVCHRKCLENLVIICGHQKLPRKTHLFGAEFTQIAKKEQDGIPFILKICVSEIESRALCLQGIYRISGNKVKTEKLCQALENGMHLVDISEFSLHDICDVLKLYLRQLPEPFISFRLYNEFIDLAKEIQHVNEEHDTKKDDLEDTKWPSASIEMNRILLKSKDLLRRLPASNLNSLHYLIMHLKRVVDHSEENKMNSKNLGLIFGPSLIRPRPTTAPVTMASLIEYSNQARLVVFLIAYSQKIFDGSLQPQDVAVCSAANAAPQVDQGCPLKPLLSPEERDPERIMKSPSFSSKEDTRTADSEDKNLDPVSSFEESEGKQNVSGKRDACLTDNKVGLLADQGLESASQKAEDVSKTSKPFTLQPDRETDGAVERCAPRTKSRPSFENVSMDSVDSSVEKGNCSSIQVDSILLQNTDSVALTLSYVKTWSKYTENIVSWVEKKPNLELESSRNIVKLAEATRTNLGLQEFMPLQSVFTSALTNDMESSLLLQQTIAAVQADQFVQPLLERKNEMEQQRKEMKELWKQEKDKVLETETALKKAKLLWTQRQEEYEKAKCSMFRAEEEHQSSSGGLVESVNKQLEKKRRLQEEALQRVEEANEIFEVCVRNVEEKRNDLEIIERAVLTQLQRVVFQGDLTLKTVTVNLFHMQQQQAASLANHLQSFCDTAKLYEPGQEYSKFIQAMSSTEEEKVDGSVTKPSTNSSHSSGYGPADSLGDAVRLPHSSSKTDEDRCSAGADVPDNKVGLLADQGLESASQKAEDVSKTSKPFTLQPDRETDGAVERCAPRTKSRPSFENVSMDSVDSSVEKGNCSSIQVDSILSKNTDSVALTLSYVKTWSKYTENIVSWVEKKPNLELESSRNIVKLAEATRTNLGLQEFMPLQSVFTSALTNDMESSLLLQQTIAAVQADQFVQPLLERKNEMEQQRKEMKELWKQEKDKVLETETALKKAKLLCTQRQDEYEKAKSSMFRAEEERQSSSGGLVESVNKQLEKKRRLQEEALQRVEEANEFYKVCVRNVEEKRNDLEIIERAVLTQLQRVVFQGDLTLKTVTVNLFHMQQQQAASLANNLQSFCDTAKLYEPGQEYSKFVQAMSSTEEEKVDGSVTKPSTNSSHSSGYEPADSLGDAVHLSHSSSETEEDRYSVGVDVPGPSFKRSWTFGMISDLESTGGSSESRSLDSESVSPGDFHRKLPRTPSSGTMSSADDLDEREPPSPSEGGPNSVGVCMKPFMSKAALTHKFRKRRFPTNCRDCGGIVVFQGVECEECLIVCHRKCLENLVIICGHQKLPRKTRLFGAAFTQIAEREPGGIPFILKICVSEIESRALCLQGIYRKHGNKIKTKKLCQALENGMHLVDISEFSLHDICDVLKLYLRQLPEPFILFRLYNEFIDLAKEIQHVNEEHDTKKDDLEDKKWPSASIEMNRILLKSKDLLRRLPASNLNSLHYLIMHLKRVVDHSEENKMNSKNLGLIFGPSLIRPRPTTAPVTMASLIEYSNQARVVEFLIAYSQKIFDGSLQPQDVAVCSAANAAPQVDQGCPLKPLLSPEERDPERIMKSPSFSSKEDTRTADSEDKNLDPVSSFEESEGKQNVSGKLDACLTDNKVGLLADQGLESASQKAEDVSKTSKPFTLQPDRETDGAVERCAPRTKSRPSFENVSMDSVDSSVEKGNCSSIQVDSILSKNTNSVALTLSYVKTWSKYTENIVSWVEKKPNLELESSRNIVKLAEATRTNFGLQEFMPLQSVFTSALTNDMESSLLLQQTIAAVQADQFVQPLLERKNDMERQRKEMKELWKQEKDKVLETETALKKAKLLCTQRQEEYEKAKCSMFRAEEEHQASSGGLVESVNKQLEKKRRLEEEALQRVEEANEFYKVCVINVEERRNDLEIIERAVLTQLQRVVFQGDLTLKAVTVNLFHMQQQQAASLANNLQSFCDTAKLYEPGQEYSKFVQATSSTEEEKVDGSVTKPSTNSSHSSGYGPADSLGDAVRLPHSSSKTDEDRCSAGADVPGPNSVGVCMKPFMSKAALTHKFRKWRFPTKCRDCEGIVLFQGFECEECLLVCHQKCLENLVIICGHQKLPRKTRLFGAAFTQIAEREPGGIPFILKICVSEVESRALCLQGIYCLSGNKIKTEKLCQALENGMHLVDISEFSLHDICDVLKLYLRQLPEPFILFRLYNEFIDLAKEIQHVNEEHDTKKDDLEDKKWPSASIEMNRILLKSKDLLRRLPASNLNSLHYLIMHLKRVVDHSEENKMNSKNLGLIFGPSLIRPRPTTAPVRMSLFRHWKQARVVEFLIAYSQKIFDGSLQPQDVAVCSAANAAPQVDQGCPLKPLLSPEERDPERIMKSPSFSSKEDTRTADSEDKNLDPVSSFEESEGKQNVSGKRDACLTGNCSSIQVDSILLQNTDSVALTLSYVKTWSKYTENIVSWAKKKPNLELESSRNIVKLAEATRTNLGLQEFMPLQSVFTSALTNDMESSLLLQQTIAAVQANQFVQPLIERKNEMERQRKEMKELWKQEKDKVLETETALKKAKLLCTQRQEEYEKAKCSMFRAEEEHQASSGGLVESVNKQLEKKRRLEEEALQRVEEANEFYKVCVINVEERRNDLEIIERAVLTQLQRVVFQGDLTLKAVAVNLFRMQQQQAASLANNLQSFCDTAKLYEPGQEYSKFVQAMSSTEEEKVDGSVTKPSTNSSHSSGYGPADSLGDAVHLSHSSSKTDEDRCSAGADVPGPSFKRSWTFGMISDLESTGGSSESRSLDSESISPGDFHRKLPRTPSSGTMSSADDLDEREPPSPSEGGPNSFGVCMKPFMSKAALTHKFRKRRFPTKCRDCEGIVLFQGFECEECLIVCHRKCLENLVIICGHQKLPRKTRLFGAAFTQIAEREPGGIPFILKICVSEIESRALCLQGIYQKHGNKIETKKLCQALENGMHLVDISEFSLHDICDVLKLYLRQLPEPFILFRLYKEFIDLAKEIQNVDEEHETKKDDLEDKKWPSASIEMNRILLKSKDLLRRLPASNLNSLHYFIMHLKRVVDHSEENKMNSKNLGLIFGPSLIRPRHTTAPVRMSSLQARVVEFLIAYSQKIFDGSLQPQDVAVCSAANAAPQVDQGCPLKPLLSPEERDPERIMKSPSFSSKEDTRTADSEDKNLDPVSSFEESEGKQNVSGKRDACLIDNKVGLLADQGLESASQKAEDVSKTSKPFTLQPDRETDGAVERCAPRTKSRPVSLPVYRLLLLANPPQERNGRHMGNVNPDKLCKNPTFEGVTTPTICWECDGFEQQTLQNTGEKQCAQNGLDAKTSLIVPSALREAGVTTSIRIGGDHVVSASQPSKPCPEAVRSARQVSEGRTSDSCPAAPGRAPRTLQPQHWTTFYKPCASAGSVRGAEEKPMASSPTVPPGSAHASQEHVLKSMSDSEKAPAACPLQPTRKAKENCEERDLPDVQPTCQETEA